MQARRRHSIVMGGAGGTLEFQLDGFELIFDGDGGRCQFYQKERRGRGGFALECQLGDFELIFYWVGGRYPANYLGLWSMV